MYERLTVQLKPYSTWPRPHVPRKEIPSIWWHMKKFVSSRIWQHSLCVVVQFQLVVELHDPPARIFSPFNVYIPVRSNVNNGSECAPLNFVMASAAFRLCGHHRGRHISLRINCSMIGTSRADFRSSWCKSLSNASNKPFESMTSVLSGS